MSLVYISMYTVQNHLVSHEMVFLYTHTSLYACNRQSEIKPYDVVEMNTITHQILQMFFELPLIAHHLITPEVPHRRVHDDYDSLDEYCELRVERTSEITEQILLDTPVSNGLRFRTFCGGGASLPVHNALMVLAYAIVHPYHPMLPGLEHPKQTRRQYRSLIRNILEGVIVLPWDETFQKYKCGNHHYFPLTTHISVGISVDSDTHILTYPTATFDGRRETETTLWNNEPYMFCLEANCNRQIYNALILLGCAIEQCNV